MGVGTVTTIQITPDEDREITDLKEQLKLPSKRAVVMEAVRSLRLLMEDEERRGRLRRASSLVSRGSMDANREWAPQSSALKIR